MRQEYRHHTDEQIMAALAWAAQTVDDLGIPDDLRALAFAKAVDLCTAKQIVMEQVQPGILGQIAQRGH